MSRLTSRITTTFAIAGCAIGMTTISMFAISTSADARPGTRSFTCEGVRSYIDRRGSAVLNTKNAHIYKRFVRDRTYCALVEGTRRVSVPTKDGSCSLRICYESLERKFY